MNLNKDLIKKTIHVKSYFNGSEYSCIVQEDKYINIFLTKTFEISEYVDVGKDNKIFKIERQEINPYYIDFGFFNTVQRIKINKWGDLTLDMINYLKDNYLDSILLYSASTIPVLSWFNHVGLNQLANEITSVVDEVTGEKKDENGLEKLEKIQPIIKSLISKSYYFPISINK
jgi:hypothetical protein